MVALQVARYWRLLIKTFSISPVMDCSPHSTLCPNREVAHPLHSLIGKKREIPFKYSESKSYFFIVKNEISCPSSPQRSDSSSMDPVSSVSLATKNLISTPLVLSGLSIFNQQKWRENKSLWLQYQRCTLERVMCNFFWIFMLFQAVNTVKLNFKAGLFSSTFPFEHSFLAKSQC